MTIYRLYISLLDIAPPMLARQRDLSLLTSI